MSMIFDGDSATVTSGASSIVYSTIVDTAHDNSYKFEQKKEGKGISLGLYFRYVKSKMNKMQKKEMKERVRRLQCFIKDAEDLDQRALVETLQEKLVGIVDKMELLSTGIKYYVDRKTIDKHKRNIYDWHEDIIGLCKLEDFPRAIPRKIKTQIAERKKQGVFKEYWILYTKGPDEDDVKTNEEKIREKDPILFGVFNDPDTFYYIADWEDEYCNLTLDKFIDDVKFDDNSYEIDEIEDFNDSAICKIRQEVKDRAQRLADTNIETWRDTLAEEQESKLEEITKKPWWKIW